MRTDPPAGWLQWDYSCADDVLTAWFGTPKPADDVPVGDHIVVRIDRATQRPVGIIVKDAAKRSGRWPGALDGAFARALLDRHGPAALKTWRAQQHGVPAQPPRAQPPRLPPPGPGR
jgi:hypothetical protein